MSPLPLPTVEDIKRLRRRLGLTQSELADLAGVSQSLVSQIESGEVDPRLSTVTKIVWALNAQEVGRNIFAEELSIKDVVSVGPDEKVVKAANLMWKHYISQLPVIHNGKNVGSVSEKSITAEIAKGSAQDLSRKTVNEIMQEPFPMVGKKTRLDVIVSLLQESPAVLVFEEGKIEGIITKADLIRAAGLGSPKTQARIEKSSSK